jgi:serine/threonine-protein kinase
MIALGASMEDSIRATLRRLQAAAGRANESIFEMGEVVGRIYEIRRLLGQGGMGQVFEAHDHALERRVAIKANWPDLDAPPLRDEARALAAFRHPSLVTVHGIGVHRGIDYIVMERVYGVSLQELINQRRAAGQKVTVEEAFDILTRVAEGLAVVHRAGIAHRDIKPGNVMLTPDHRVVLMDFGLVLPEFDMASQEFIAGSPPYMSAEALTNTLEPGSGPLVDIYALGVTAFELLTGELPRDAVDLTDLYRLHHDPIPDLRAHRPDVPVALAALIYEMMATDPGARPQGAEPVAWQLRKLRAGPAPAATRPARAMRVLVVDDDPDVVRILKFYVKAAVGKSTEVETALDGEKALEAMRRSRFDVVLLDLHMPEMNGIEVCMYMRGERLGEDCTVVSVSAGAQDHDRALMHQLGIEYFVTKGEQLRENVEAILKEIAGARGVLPD